MHRKLRKRLTLLCTVIIFTILLCMTILFLGTLKKQVTEKGDAEFLRDVNGILFYMKSQSTFDHTWFSQTENNSNLLIYPEINGQPLLYSTICHTKENLELIASARKIAKESYDLDISIPPKGKFQSTILYFDLKSQKKDSYDSYYSAVITVPIEDGYIGIITLKDKEGEELQFQSIRNSFIFFAGITFILFIVIIWFLTGYLIHPLELNQQRQSEFIHAASHELRSPLSVIKTSLSMIQNAPKEISEHFSQMAQQECTRMSRLVDDLLILAGSDTGSYQIRKEETEIELLLLITYERFEQLAKDKKILLTVVPPIEPLPKCNCDKDRILQVLAILLDNAIHYTPSGGTIRFTADSSGKEIRICVADNGPGIAKEYRKKVFERFYRREEARSQKEHFGLGLSIAAEILELSNGKIVVGETQGGGATFYVSLPIAKKSKND